jgi:lipid-binding SYLF domain-containing protein
MKILSSSAVILAFAACATAPKTMNERQVLADQARTTLTAMMDRDVGLRSTLDRSAGYAVFPEIGKGGLIVGGAHGQGILYQRGREVGFVSLSQASVGAQIGAQTFAELIVFQRDQDVARLKTGAYSLGGNVSAVALTTGAAASAPFANGVAVFVLPRGGAMAELSVSGQKINYQPLGA